MKKILTVLLSVYVAIVLFLPKEQIVYTALNTLQKELVSFEIEDFSDYGVVANASGISVIYDSMRVAKIEDAKIIALLFYNRVDINLLSPAGNFANMLDAKVYKATISEVFYDPFVLKIDADSSIGNITGSFDIATSKLRVLIKPNASFSSFKYKNYFRKTREGYLYEAVIK